MAEKRKSLKLPSDHPGTKKLEILMETGKPIADILQEYLPESDNEILMGKFLNLHNEIIKIIPGPRTENKLEGLSVLFNCFVVRDMDQLDQELFTKEIPAMLRGFANYEEMLSKGSDQ